MSEEEIELTQPENSGSCIVKLKHPDSNAEFWILGTAHVSLTSAEEATELIKRVSPDLVIGFANSVVLELDPERFTSMALEARRRGISGVGALDNLPLSRSAAAKAPLATRGDSIPKVFGLVLSGELPAYLGALFYGISGAVLGVFPGSEFLAAAIAAREVGARVVLADRDAGVTMSRIRARVFALRSGRLLSSDDDAPAQRPAQRFDGPAAGGSGGGGPGSRASAGAGAGAAEAPGADGRRGPAKMREELLKAGCDVDKVQAQFRRAIAAGLDGQRIDPADLQSVRTCGRRLVENQRTAVMARGAGEPGADLLFAPEDDEEGAPSVAPGRSLKRALGREFGRVLQRTIVEERDLILAKRMQEEAGFSSQRIVAVVGAGHLPGIQAAWQGARTPLNYKRAKEFSNPQPEDVVPPKFTDYPGTIAGALFAGALAVRRPRTFAKVAGVFTGIAGVGSTIAAHSVVKASRLVQQLEEAARALPAGAEHGSGEFA